MYCWMGGRHISSSLLKERKAGLSKNGGTENGSYNTSIDWPLYQRYSICNYDKGAGKYTSRSHPGNSTADDEGDGIWSRSANNRANLKDKDCGQVNPFDAKEGVEFAEKQLEGTSGEQIGWETVRERSTM